MLKIHIWKIISNLLPVRGVRHHLVFLISSWWFVTCFSYSHEMRPHTASLQGSDIPAPTRLTKLLFNKLMSAGFLQWNFTAHWIKTDHIICVTCLRTCDTYMFALEIHCQHKNYNICSPAQKTPHHHLHPPPPTWVQLNDAEAHQHQPGYCTGQQGPHKPIRTCASWLRGDSVSLISSLKALNFKTGRRQSNEHIISPWRPPE